jgi:site-specific recombinase XerD
MKVGHLLDPKLRRLGNCLLQRSVAGKAPSTSDRYSRAFEKFKTWTSQYAELSGLPTDSLTICLYLESLIESGSSYSVLESAFYGIRWAHVTCGLDNPCESRLVSNILESAKRALSKPVCKKEPVTPEMISKICECFAQPTSSLLDLRSAALCLTAYSEFLRYNELAGLRCCDVRFVGESHVELTIVQSKTDVYREGSKVLLAKNNVGPCPFSLLTRFVQETRIDLSSELPFFRNLRYVRGGSYVVCDQGLSYSRARTVVKGVLIKLGYSPQSYGLHSLRSGGATAAANAGVPDRMFKRHGRWKSEKAKDGYIKDNISSLLSVSKSIFK